MDLLLKKFPIHENIEWNKHLAEKDQATQSKPFVEFMLWLEKLVKFGNCSLQITQVCKIGLVVKQAILRIPN